VRVGKSQFAADGMGDGLEITGVIAAEGTRLSGNSRKLKDPQYTEIAQGLKIPLYRWSIDGGRPMSPRTHPDDF
jgi:1-acyl-sn-glycerol-3-phosphate acyltransferase